VTDLESIAAGTDSDGLGRPMVDPWGNLLGAFQRALWSGDLHDAERIAAEAFRTDAGLTGVYERMITPALHQVGNLWSTGELTVADEHLATEVTLRAMAGVFALAEARSVATTSRRCVVTATAEGERHGVGLRMASDALELAGHEVVHCGVDTPVEDLAALALSARADAVAISFTMASSGDSLAATAEHLALELPGLPLLVGGQGLPAYIPDGPVTRVGSLDELVALVDALPARQIAPAAARRPINPLAPRPRAIRPPEAYPAPAERPDLGSAHLRALLAGSDDALALLDQGGAVTAWNPAAEALFGHSAEAALGRHVDSLVVAPERSRSIRRCLREAMAGETVESRESHTSPDDGSPLTVLLRLLPVHEAGESRGAALIARDVTHRREAAEFVESHGRLWHNRIEHALAEDRFVLAAQPVIDLATDEVDHCELLLRLRMGGKIVMPGEFIPPAERSGQIRAIDTWVAEAGIELATEHPIAINLSGASLSSPSLPKTIESTLARVGVDPDRVTFEITETAAAENIEEAAGLVTGLRDLGCRVALDDFGTGFGSFTYLSRLPVTELKIDNEFARGVRTGVAERRVIDAVVSVGKAFGIRTVAEGVEDEETLAILREAGVDLGQGWLFGKPRLVDTEVEAA
jgi:PAS domain S-box-containing protein